ncbi:BamA/TamA family outer membrane protein [Flavobacterium aciduliphilum]|nr:hypothetical protein [Flavobacterium aciduliphilum]
MKQFLFIMFFMCSLYSQGQKWHVKINGQNEFQTQTIDSIGYTSSFNNPDDQFNEKKAFTEKLLKLGFLEHELLTTKKLNDSTFLYTYELGKKTKTIHIYISNIYNIKEWGMYRVKNDTLTLPFSESELFLNATLKKLESDGFSMAKIHLAHLNRKKDFVTADLIISSSKKRILNDIVINGYEKFPIGYTNNLKRIYKKRAFNQDNIDRLYRDVSQYRFVKQTKYPEILFTKDSTKLFVYLEKAKANSFDGFIGFTNDENSKLIFTGNVDLKLMNLLNSGEKLALYWKSNGKDQRTFNINVVIPYIFKSPIGLKTQLNIFKQDSTYQNTSTSFNLGYYFNYNTRVYLGYQATESSDIKNTNSLLLSDYKNTFYTTNFEYNDYDPNMILFPEKSSISMLFGSGRRDSKFQQNHQFFGNLLFKHHFYLNAKNSINIKSQNYYLQSEAYITNELYRYGGINSIRGFNENSLQATLLSSVLTEYCYILSPSLYLHSIFDYGYFQDKTTSSSGNLMGLGFGFGLLTKNGLLNFVYANGSTNNQAIKLSNSIIHISLKTNF